MFDKLKFWKKDDGFDFNFNDPQSAGSAMDAPVDLGLPNSPSNPPSFQPVPEQNSYDSAPYNNGGVHTGMNPPAFTPPTQQPQVQEQSPPDTANRRDVELILSKIETLKARVDHLTTRIEHLERLANDKQRW